MRYDVKKYLIAGPSGVRNDFFKKVQALGIVECISTKPESQEVPREVETLKEALHILRTMTPMPSQEVGAGIDYHSAHVLANHIVEQNEHLEKAREQKRLLNKEIARVAPFGDFSISGLHSLEKEAHRAIQFYFCKKPELLEAPKRDEVIFVGAAYNLSYFVAINPKPTSYDGLIEMKIERSLGELEHALAQVNRDIDEREVELGTLARNRKLLLHGLADALNDYHLEQSKQRAEPHLEGVLFATQVWVPKNQIKTLLKLADALSLTVEPISIEKKDRVPTYLQNKGPARLGEDLVGIYDTPATTDRDPSLWVFISFGIFFSMIVADMGYGLILLGISLFMFKKFGKKGGLARRVLKLSIYLSAGCIFWGAMLPSFFGVDFAPDSKWRSVSVIGEMVKRRGAYAMEHKTANYKEAIKKFPKAADAKTPTEFFMAGMKEKDGWLSYPIYRSFEDAVLLELALFIGTLHIIASFLRYLDKNWAAIGWTTFMVGAYLFFPKIVKATSLIHYLFGIPQVAGAEIGYYMIWIGLGAAWVLAIIQKRLKGIGEPMHVIGVFADVMSYLRIYALSLAGMIMAQTFDHIGVDAPIYAGFLIILAGHMINFVLALMGGVIHGLRLNFIEWYHYSFDGGGRWFKPLSLLKID